MSSVDWSIELGSLRWPSITTPFSISSGYKFYYQSQSCGKPLSPKIGETPKLVCSSSNALGSLWTFPPSTNAAVAANAAVAVAANAAVTDAVATASAEVLLLLSHRGKT